MSVETAAPSDVVRGLDLCALLAPKTPRLKVAVVHGAPGSKSALGRPVADAAWDRLLLGLAPAPAERAFDGNVALAAIFLRPNRQRIDVDNMLKLVLDAGTRVGLWRDDSQVTALLGLAEQDIERPRTIILVAEHASTLNRGERRATCAKCGTVFVFHGDRAAKFCSRECCSYLTTVPCALCEKLFKRKTAAQRFCGDACRLRALAISRRQKFPLSFCADCGFGVSKPGYARCRECWKAARAEGVS